MVGRTSNIRSKLYRFTPVLQIKVHGFCGYGGSCYASVLKMILDRAVYTLQITQCIYI